MEKRGAERFEMRVPATLHLGGNPGEVLDLETTNVSSKGAFLLTDRTVPRGVGVRVELRLPLSEALRMVGSGRNVKITVGGRVVRKQEDGIAVQFGSDYRIEPA